MFKWKYLSFEIPWEFSSNNLHFSFSDRNNGGSLNLPTIVPTAITVPGFITGFVTGPLTTTVSPIFPTNLPIDVRNGLTTGIQQGPVGKRWSWKY